jgi:hypothetical protein
MKSKGKLKIPKIERKIKAGTNLTAKKALEPLDQEPLMRMKAARAKIFQAATVKVEKPMLWQCY